MRAPATPTLALAVACYNEQPVLNLTLERLLSELHSLIGRGLAAQDSFIVVCDDGSTDATWSIIERWHSAHPQAVRGLRLSTNCGQQTAFMAALDYARGRCDAAVTLDADLQHPPEAIASLVEAYMNTGAGVVGTTPAGSRKANPLKGLAATAYYRLQRLMGIDIEPGQADFRLLSAEALERLTEFGDHSPYLRALVRQLGLPVVNVTYPQARRAAGTTKYSLGRMCSLGLDGITQFTLRPLRLMLWGGLATALLTVVAAGVLALCGALTAWGALALSLWFWGGALLGGLGLVGEYVGKTLAESRRRPRYFVADTLDASKPQPTDGI